jgi:hypothetical protein
MRCKAIATNITAPNRNQGRLATVDMPPLLLNADRTRRNRTQLSIACETESPYRAIRIDARRSRRSPPQPQRGERPQPRVKRRKASRNPWKATPKKASPNGAEPPTAQRQLTPPPPPTPRQKLLTRGFHRGGRGKQRLSRLLRQRRAANTPPKPHSRSRPTSPPLATHLNHQVFLGLSTPTTSHYADVSPRPAFPPSTNTPRSLHSRTSSPRPETPRARYSRLQYVLTLLVVRPSRAEISFAENPSRSA